MKRLLILLILPFAAHANDYRPTYISNYVANTTYETGVASALASTNHHFTYGTLNLQWSIAYGQYRERGALSYAMGLRPCDKCPLISGSIATSNDENVGFSVGIGGRF